MAHQWLAARQPSPDSRDDRRLLGLATEYYSNELPRAVEKRRRERHLRYPYVELIRGCYSGRKTCLRSWRG